jgi:ParB family transcriptional regulator, chromosome partitioning protein
MKIEQLAVEALIPYALNSRTHDDAQVAQIASSIREFGFTNPVLIDKDGGIIAGHGRVMAARKLALTKVPCIRMVHLTDTQRRAYVIVDNKLALNAGWDQLLLEGELQGLHSAEFDMGLLGFEAVELQAAMGIDMDTHQSRTKEIDPDEFDLNCKCPKCGFEFDAKT